MKSKKYEELNELKRLIKKRNYSYRKLSKTINISVDALNNKLNGYSLLNIEEINRLVAVLNIEPVEINRYFFSSSSWRLNEFT